MKFNKNTCMDPPKCIQDDINNSISEDGLTFPDADYVNNSIQEAHNLLIKKYPDLSYNDEQTNIVNMARNVV